ncbi:corrinoid protein [Microbacterium sp.]|uniref:corrinoid protein n=1 Tax=Microbacterium sp. TaxID=51671 RepID=UPI003563FB08
MANEDFYQQAKDAIRACDRARATEVATQALAAGVAPDELLKSGFIPGIAAMGDLFERGEVFLPELVLAADAMTGAAEVCNAALPEGEAEKKATVVIGTVQGDVHDIGKTIVVAFLRANGYEVFDLGRDIAADKFIAAAEEKGADVIGMSALLTTTMREQTRVLAALDAAGLRSKYKVIVGGGASTQQWADKIGADAYAEDANDGVRKINELMGN